MRILKCDICGADMGEDLPVRRILSDKVKFNDQDGRFAFEVVNCEFRGARGDIVKLDFCAMCIAGMAEIGFALARP